jgi:hypothetical protein
MAQNVEFIVKESLSKTDRIKKIDSITKEVVGKIEKGEAQGVTKHKVSFFKLANTIILF